jgi:hypothetical protein
VGAVSDNDKFKELLLVTEKFTMLELLDVVISRLHSVKFNQNQEEVRMANKMVNMSSVAVRKVTVDG